jgi:hypothetical protein
LSQSDPRNAHARAKNGTRRENDRTDYSDIGRFPILFELKVGGYSVDIAPGQRIVNGTEVIHTPPEFPAALWHVSHIFKHDRVSGTKMLIATIPARAS